MMQSQGQANTNNPCMHEYKKQIALYLIKISKITYLNEEFQTF
jgi:hypothetical protein